MVEKPGARAPGFFHISSLVMRIRVPALVSALILLGCAAAKAQEEPHRRKIAVINTLIGGSTAAVTAAIHHRRVLPAFIKGSVGGLAVFGGKCLIARQKTAAYWLGQQTVAIGSSFIANGETGRGMFERIALPIGPLRIYRDNKEHRFEAKLDLMETGIAAYYLASSSTHVDWHLSAKHDALIMFGGDGDERIEVAGLIKVRHDPSFRLVHEEIHVAQDQFVTTALEDPLEGWLFPIEPGKRNARQYFEFGVLAPVWALVNSQINREDRPWEKEADAFFKHC